jgi:hypothetical protein
MACVALEPLRVSPGPAPTPAIAALQWVHAVGGHPCVDLGTIIDGQPQRVQSWSVLVVAQHPWPWD